MILQCTVSLRSETKILDCILKDVFVKQIGQSDSKMYNVM